MPETGRVKHPIVSGIVDDSAAGIAPPAPETRHPPALSPLLITYHLVKAALGVYAI